MPPAAGAIWAIPRATWPTWPSSPSGSTTAKLRRRCSALRCATGCCASMLALGPGDRVLELGCGNGKFLLWNRELAGLERRPRPGAAVRRRRAARPRPGARRCPPAALPQPQLQQALVDRRAGAPGAARHRPLPGRGLPRAGAGRAAVHLLQHSRARPASTCWSPARATWRTGWPAAAWPIPAATCCASRTT